MCGTVLTGFGMQKWYHEERHRIEKLKKENQEEKIVRDCCCFLVGNPQPVRGQSLMGGPPCKA